MGKSISERFAAIISMFPSSPKNEFECSRINQIAGILGRPKLSGKTEEVVETKLKNCLKNIDKNQILGMDICYEPIWAISKGDPNHKAATAEDAEEGHKLVRDTLKNIYDAKTAKNVRVIYGGSMKPENAKELLSMPNINGGLVGNASLDAKRFAEVCKIKN